VEGFLLLQAQYEAAQREAQRFTERMPWLTTAQQEEVIRQYVQERRHLTRLTLTAVAWRSHRLREEYEARYALLRVRLLKLSAVAVCGALVWTACLTVWVSWSAGD
ncbi:hypothetical protein, partial [Streptomyces sp. NPDC059371]|uniref:hypothetical protein n=1 Tax=Streptomyces sp. NPDC059371 TaxID=3346812 RepID=UPI0036CA6398